MGRKGSRKPGQMAGKLDKSPVLGCTESSEGAKSAPIADAQSISFALQQSDGSAEQFPVDMPMEEKCWTFLVGMLQANAEEIGKRIDRNLIIQVIVVVIAIGYW
jgi:hypothetical protein